jgi:hypothetical protein
VASLLFTLEVIEAGEGNSMLPWLSTVALAGSAAAGALFIRVERRSRNPLVRLRFFRNRPRVLANISTALVSAALSNSFLLLTYYLQDPLARWSVAGERAPVAFAEVDRAMQVSRGFGGGAVAGRFGAPGGI